MLNVVLSIMYQFVPAYQDIQEIHSDHVGTNQLLVDQQIHVNQLLAVQIVFAVL